jgi:ppGpp synthetase/RelA/SpoT-type nucleotidyltranferase
VPLPFSRSKIERLGERLIAGPEPADEDIADLHRLLEAYDEVLATTLIRVRSAIDVAPTSRVKNTGTILEKLHRQGGSWLKSMHDLAGMRIVSATNRHEQDTLTQRVVALFAAESRQPRVIDRRETPSHGYHAVHVIVFPEDMAVEIQVRTRWQHEWADMFEKLADRIGRDIRYGAPPEHWLAGPERSALEGRSRELYELEYELRAGIVSQALTVADLISAVERLEILAPDAEDRETNRRSVAEILIQLRESIESLGE